MRRTVAIVGLLTALQPEPPPGASPAEQLRELRPRDEAELLAIGQRGEPSLQDVHSACTAGAGFSARSGALAGIRAIRL